MQTSVRLRATNDLHVNVSMDPLLTFVCFDRSSAVVTAIALSGAEVSIQDYNPRLATYAVCACIYSRFVSHACTVGMTIESDFYATDAGRAHFSVRALGGSNAP